jgi:predicted transcriptional regulator
LDKREPSAIYIDILANLMDGPKGPTRLAQACNINYGRLAGFTDKMVEKGLIRRETLDQQEVLAATEDGCELYHKWSELRKSLPL